jgi:hypothetical protein
MMPLRADDVLIDGAHRLDLLAHERALHVADLVAVVGGELVLPVLRGLVHARLQRLDQLLALALQEQHGLVHRARVGLAVDLEDARPRAALDLVLQAGPRAVVQDVVVTRAQAEVLVEHAQGLPHRGRRVVGAEVLGAVALLAAHDLDARPLRLGVDAQRQEILVVAQLYVVPRLMRLDQAVLEEQRLLLVARDDRLDVAEDAGQALGEGARVGAAEVLAQAGAQVDGFADVHDLAALVLHQIAARLRGRAIEDGLELLVHLSGLGAPATPRRAGGSSRRERTRPRARAGRASYDTTARRRERPGRAPGSRG